MNLFDIFPYYTVYKVVSRSWKLATNTVLLEHSPGCCMKCEQLQSTTLVLDGMAWNAK